VPICGNGAQEVPEECDDGNLESDDCCSSSCTAESAGGACAEDGNVCTYDLCDGRGACVHIAGNAGLTCRPPLSPCDTPEQCSGVSSDCPADVLVPDGTDCDATACLTGETCAAGICGGGSPVACAVCEGCNAVAGCVAAPVEVCRQPILPGRSTLLMKDQNPSTSDKIVWKWAKGEETTPADFGTPNLDDDYTVCLYDETTLSTALVARIMAPAAGACTGGGCWRSTSSGFKYVDPDLTPDGIRKMLLKGGASGTSAITFKAKGDNIPMPILPLGSVLRLQLQGNGECWEATFSPGGISQNDFTGFQARSD
jgi:cysteine-rich repeat protein